MKEIRCLSKIGSLEELSSTRYLRDFPVPYPCDLPVVGPYPCGIPVVGEYGLPYGGVHGGSVMLQVAIHPEEKSIACKWVRSSDIEYGGEKYDMQFENVSELDRFIDDVYFGYDPESEKDNRFLEEAASGFMPAVAIISHLEGVAPKSGPVVSKSIEFSKELLKELKKNRSLEKKRRDKLGI